MSDPTPLRTLAFGGLDTTWGAAWFAGQGGAGLLVLGGEAGAQALEAELDLAESGGSWRVRAAGAELVVEPAGEPLALAETAGGAAGVEQECTVSGMRSVAGRSEAIDAPGLRGEHRHPALLERLDSVRKVSAWFADGEAVGVQARRPRKAHGHEQDAVSAAVLAGPSSPPIVDPRLSTTYDAAGRPTRVNLELWTDDPEQFPRRLAGEAVGQSADGAIDRWSLHAELMRCHSRGQDGTGVYLLVRPA